MAWIMREQPSSIKRRFHEEHSSASRGGIVGTSIPLWGRIRAIAIVVSICMSVIGGVVQPNWQAVVRHGVRPQGLANLFMPVQASSYQYKTTVTGDSPVAYWPCDEGTGTTCGDASGNGHTATFVCVYPNGCSALPTSAPVPLVAGTSSSVTCCSGSTTCCNVGANAANPFGLPATRSVEAVYSCSNPSNCGSPNLFHANGTSEVKLGISSSTRIVGISGGMGGTCSTGANLYDGLPHLLDLV